MRDPIPVGVTAGEPLIDEGLPLVLAITTPGCNHCRALRPTLESVASVHDGAVDYMEISAQDRHDLVDRLGVRTTPTVLALRDGRVLRRHVGAGSRSDMEHMFRTAEGGPAVRGTLGLTDRLLRSGAGIALALIGGLAAAWWLLGTGLVLFAGGWYDLAFSNDTPPGGQQPSGRSVTPPVGTTKARHGSIASPKDSKR